MSVSGEAALTLIWPDPLTVMGTLPVAVPVLEPPVSVKIPPMSRRMAEVLDRSALVVSVSVLWLTTLLPPITGIRLFRSTPVTVMAPPKFWVFVIASEPEGVSS